ncbi:TolC family protein [Mucilaginibacter sp. UR6-11]|uniref:TolC family protein n=1 Tax=Mucilaginibacter sp. UR6-11 TaxID=1435644 RepID=UPI001E491EE6|nr:TolC family protein [Mucilaginibacter sp. UR6-11]MCC8425338.1 TolC family protein [Mucilaginibacter sp. UR6-11]
MTKFIIKKVSILSVFCMTLIGFAATAQEKITLQMAVDRTLANNLTIKQAQVNEVVGSVDLEQAKNNLLPSLNASSSGGYNFGRSQVGGQLLYTTSTSFNASGDAQMQVTLFQGGQLRNQIIQNRLALDVNKGQTAKVKNDLILSVVTTYLQILTNQDLVVAAKQQLELANQTLDRSDISFKVGNQTLADLSQAKAQVSTATLSLTTAQNQLDLSMLILKQYMEMNPYTPIEIERPDISKLTDIKTLYDANEVVRTALTVNPDIRLAELQQKTYQQAIKVAKGYYYPTVSLYGGLGSNYSNKIVSKTTSFTDPDYEVIGRVAGTSTNVLTLDKVSHPISGPYSAFDQIRDNFNQNIGLNIQIPIFNKFNTRTTVRKAELNLQSAQLNTQIAKNNLSKTIIQAVLDLQAADKQYQSATQTFEANKEALNVTKQRYDVGLVNSLDYNTAVTNYNKSQNDMIAAKYTVIFRSKIIDYYLGNTITL